MTSPCSVNFGRLMHREGPNASAAYGAGSYGFPVVVDPVSEQPMTKLFSNFEGLKSVAGQVVDRRRQAAGLIKAAFEPASQLLVDRYTQKLRVRANQLYANATSDGSIKMLPDGRLPPKLQDARSDPRAGGNAGRHVANAHDRRAQSEHQGYRHPSLKRARVTSRSDHSSVRGRLR